MNTVQPKPKSPKFYAVIVSHPTERGFMLPSVKDSRLGACQRKWEGEGYSFKLQGEAKPLQPAAPSLATVPTFADTARKEKPVKKQGRKEIPKLAIQVEPDPDKPKPIPRQSKGIVSLTTGKYYPASKRCV
ncbi:hypothetical protein [Spirosoma luteum]|uniref:hypothetical protein n=1 Tax=Spirosoma luteum TaxID=431553 RepID=UPI000363EF7A|nr:hypothetical protein [Spirosoma luteum]